MDWHYSFPAHPFSLSSFLFRSPSLLSRVHTGTARKSSDHLTITRYNSQGFIGDPLNILVDLPTPPSY
ncbi:hypothetical protein E2C01_051967 [Portunus trituberculatus]|uniref:Uncharacterized protein n=1 Tax=Portunus trituberculatus TaxID=210409 RepID=A0A5B7GKQ4_PORTR|nr:hypothetical protein [Portunus trituberculatus]